MHITASYTITLTEKEWKTIQEILDETNTDTTCSAMTLATSLRQKHGKYDDRVRNYFLCPLIEALGRLPKTITVHIVVD